MNDKTCKICGGKRYANLNICYSCYRKREKEKKEEKAKRKLERKPAKDFTAGQRTEKDAFKSLPRCSGKINITGDRIQHSVIKITRDNISFGTNLHPTQKPVALFEYLIKTYTNENDLVLDNTAGSGTTGVACKNTNRNFILIEQDEKYWEVIKERVGCEIIKKIN